MTEENVEGMIKLVELNIGKWKPKAIAVVDVNYNTWGERGSKLEEFVEFYRKFPLSAMHVGDSVHNNNSFLMKITEKTGIIVVMSDPQIARLASINLKNRINALSDFYNLEKHVTDKKEKKSKINGVLKKEEEMW
ncbi:MAG: hypothetical protein ACTSP1_17540 [Candidatus Freyarchaeota archaeon]